jgi:hypothetical protein
MGRCPLLIRTGTRPQPYFADDLGVDWSGTTRRCGELAE